MSPKQDRFLWMKSREPLSVVLNVCQTQSVRLFALRACMHGMESPPFLWSGPAIEVPKGMVESAWTRRTGPRDRSLATWRRNQKPVEE